MSKKKVNIQQVLQAHLTGAQLINLTKDEITVKLPNGRKVWHKGKVTDTVTLKFVKDDGYWCGYAEVQSELKISKEDLKNNPIIANIKVQEIDDDDCDQSCFKITLVGLHKTLAKINGQAGSDSGWAYGATVDLKCKPLNIDYTLCSW